MLRIVKKIHHNFLYLRHIEVKIIRNLEYDVKISSIFLKEIMDISLSIGLLSIFTIRNLFIYEEGELA